MRERLLAPFEPPVVERVAPSKFRHYHRDDQGAPSACCVISVIVRIYTLFQQFMKIIKDHLNEIGLQSSTDQVDRADVNK
ncbi:MAG: hypothetical protein P4M15_00455 [Alphaproteobacteria bacterium]|nr:hypothetical protein [Alphaproteobacteria bacterium]